MTSSHDSAIEALDGFWNVIREKADLDPAFARAIVSALKIPIMIKIEPPLDAEAFKAVHAYISPRALIELGEERFREFFNALTDAQKKAVIKNQNYASADAIAGKKGAALVDIVWLAANAQADRLSNR
jgi:hypothetical protein